MKKLVAMCLAGTIAVSGLCGCSKTKENGEDAGNKKLTWFIPVEEQVDSKIVIEEANKIIKPAIGATLDMKFIDKGAYAERMKMNMASGNDYDLCFTSNWLNVFVTAVDNGSLYDITDMVSDKLKATMPDYAWNAAKMGGKLYAVPNQQIMTNPLAVQAQKSLLDKYNFDLSTVKTIEDIEPFLEIIKENEPSYIPYRTRWGMEPWMCAKYATTGGVNSINIVIPKDGDGKKFLLKTETKEYKRAITKLREWYKKGYIRSDVASAGDDTAEYNAGKYAVGISGWGPGTEAIEKAKGIEWEYALLHEPFMQMSGPRAAMTAVGADSKNPELAVKLIELVNTDKNLYNMLCYGIKDKHYNLDADGKLVEIKNSNYQPRTDWAFGNQFNALIHEGVEDNVWEETKKMNDEAVVSPIFGFEENVSAYKSEISQIQSVVTEYNEGINYQMSDAEQEAYYAEYLKKLDIAGQQKVLNELQKQLDEFWKNKK